LLNKQVKAFYNSEEKHIVSFLQNNKDVIESLNNEYKTILKPMIEKIRTESNRENKKLMYEKFVKAKKEIDGKYAEEILSGLCREYNLPKNGPIVEFKDFSGTKTVAGWNAPLFQIFLDSLCYSSPKALVSNLVHEFTHFRQDLDYIRVFGEAGYTKLRMAALYFRQKNTTKNFDMNLLGRYLIVKDISNKYLQSVVAWAKSNPLSKHDIRNTIVKAMIPGKVKYKDAKNSTEAEYFSQLIEKHAYYNGANVKKYFDRYIPENTPLL